MTAAIATAVVALALAAAGAIAGLFALAVKLADAERRCGDARADEAELAARFESMVAQRDNESARADREKERADALDAAIAEAAAKAVGPVAGSFAELLQAANAARAGAPRGDRAGALRDAGAAGGEAAADREGADDLLSPWK